MKLTLSRNTLPKPILNRPIDGRDPYLTDWTSTCIHRMTGDGILVYPTPDGPVSSIRLENVRDGSEDYDYLTMLSERCGPDAAGEFTSRLITSMTEYSRDPDRLYRARREIADRIEALGATERGQAN